MRKAQPSTNKKAQPAKYACAQDTHFRRFEKRRSAPSRRGPGVSERVAAAHRIANRRSTARWPCVRRGPPPRRISREGYVDASGTEGSLGGSAPSLCDARCFGLWRHRAGRDGAGAVVTSHHPWQHHRGPPGGSRAGNGPRSVLQRGHRQPSGRGHGGSLPAGRASRASPRRSVGEQRGGAGATRGGSVAAPALQHRPRRLRRRCIAVARSGRRTAHSAE